MPIRYATLSILVREQLAQCGAFASGDEESLSPWSISSLKRVFDFSVVIAFSPLILPVLLAVSIAVRLTSRGHVIFRQTRIGRSGRPFTIFKFKTMLDAGDLRQNTVAFGAPQITRLGRLLRRLKLDELPQVLNVLRGDMSFVGPRPRIPAEQLGAFSCRPGITSPATLAFAREDLLLALIPENEVSEYYMKTLLPVKIRLDREYMASATLLTDLSLLVSTLFRRWRNPASVQMNARVQRYSHPDYPEILRIAPGYERADIADVLDT